jgi:hypothetical protein
MYADDTTALFTGKDPDTLKSNIYKDIESVIDWFRANGLLLNGGKSYSIDFRSGRQVDCYGITSNLDTFPKSSTAKFLGLVLDDSLTWRGHIEFLLRKLNKSYFIMLSLSSRMNRKYLMMVYYAYVYSHLKYGVYSGVTPRTAIECLRNKKAS